MDNQQERERARIRYLLDHCAANDTVPVSESVPNYREIHTYATKWLRNSLDREEQLIKDVNDARTKAEEAWKEIDELEAKVAEQDKELDRLGELCEQQGKEMLKLRDLLRKCNSVR